LSLKYGAINMNMISTAFPTETDASSKQDKLVSKLVGAWEKKNSKAARAGGVSLMALSLAACGAEDDTPFAQSDIDAATAPLSAAVIVAEAATVAAQTQAASALVAQAAAETQAATAIAAQAAAEVQAATALVGKLASDAAAATATVAAATATAAAATATTAKEAAEASLATAQASLTAETAAKAAAEASLATVQASYDLLVAPKTLAATTSAVADLLLGGTGSDTFSAGVGTVVAADRFTDPATTDADTLTITHASNPGAFTATNIETIDVTLNGLGALTIDAANITGNTSLTVTRGDVLVGGATLTGNKVVQVTNASSGDIGSITAGAGTTNVDINSAATDLAGHIINADVATGNVTVDGAATINAALAARVDIDAVTNTAVAQTGKASDINAAAALRVETHADLTGAIDIAAPNATVVTVNDAQGGVTINSSTAATADAVITVADIDASGANITVGTGTDDSVTASNLEIRLTLDGGAGSTDAATISAAGHIELDIAGTGAQGNVDVLTLSGNGAGVIYDISAPTTGTMASITKAGTQSVEVMGDASEFTAVTITNIDVVDVIAGTAAAFNASLFSNVGKIDLGINNANNALTVNSGQTIEVTANQATGLDFNFSAAGGGDLTIVAGDLNPASASVDTVNFVAFDAAAAAATTVGNITIEASISNIDMEGVNLGAAQNLIITGDEDVNLSAVGTTESVVADSVNASGSSGVITINVEDSAGAVDVNSVITGSGNDIIQMDGTGVVTVSSNAGNDTITIEDADATSTFDGGAGNDTINADEVSRVVMIGGDGADNFNTSAVLTGTIIGGTGSDTITIDTDTALDLKGTTLSFTGIEEFDITAAIDKTITISGAQLAGNSTLVIDGNGAGDNFNVATVSTAAIARSADLSNVTLKSGATATITVTGDVGVDTITGGVMAESFTQTLGGDTINGGSTGIDTYNAVTALNEAGSSPASAGTVVNLGSTAVTSASVINKTTNFLSGNLSEVAAGSVGYIFANNSTVNSAILDTVGGIENVNGGTGKDYIVGNSEANVITGGLNVDHLIGGDGADDFVFTGGITIDTVGDFVTGTDDLVFDISLINTNALVIAATDLNFIDGDGTDIVAGDAVFQAIGAAAVIGATATILNYTAGTISDAAALETALENGGTGLLTTNGAAGVTALDSMLIMYDNNVNIMLAAVTFSQTIAINITLDSVDVTDIVSLEGVTVDLVTGDVAFVA
jgi:hypothetical protein